MHLVDASKSNLGVVKYLDDRGTETDVSLVVELRVSICRKEDCFNELSLMELKEKGSETSHIEYFFRDIGDI